MIPRGRHMIPAVQWAAPLLSSRCAAAMQMRVTADEWPGRDSVPSPPAVAADAELSSTPARPPAVARPQPAASRRPLRARIVRIVSHDAAVPGKLFGEACSCGCFGRLIHLRCSCVTPPSGCTQQLPAAAAASSAVADGAALRQSQRLRWTKRQLFAELALMLLLLTPAADSLVVTQRSAIGTPRRSRWAQWQLSTLARLALLLVLPFRSGRLRLQRAPCLHSCRCSSRRRHQPQRPRWDFSRWAPIASGSEEIEVDERALAELHISFARPDVSSFASPTYAMPTRTRWAASSP